MKAPQNSSFDLLPGEEGRIESALAELAKDPHAPREISVRVRLHVHNEYPKHVTVGEKTVVVNSAEEEKAAYEANPEE